MKKVLILTMVIFSLNIAAKAENNEARITSGEAKTEVAVSICSLEGSIYDPKCDEALSGAAITINGKKYYSDLSGNFSIPDLKRGKYIVTIDLISYQSKIVEIDLSKSEKLNIELKQQ